MKSAMSWNEINYAMKGDRQSGAEQSREEQESRPLSR